MSASASPRGLAGRLELVSLEEARTDIALPKGDDRRCRDQDALADGEPVRAAERGKLPMSITISWPSRAEGGRAVSWCAGGGASTPVEQPTEFELVTNGKAARRPRPDPQPSHTGARPRAGRAPVSIAQPKSTLAAPASSRTG